MPAPIRPQPRTPTVLIAISVLWNRRARSSGENKSPVPILAFELLDGFHDRGNPLSAADAGGRETTLQAAAVQLQCQREEQPRAGHAQGMAERDGPAVDVHPIAIEAELLLHGEVLRG